MYKAIKTKSRYLLAQPHLLGDFHIGKVALVKLTVRPTNVQLCWAEPEGIRR